MPHALDGGAEGSILLVLGRQVVAVHEQELAAQQADALGAHGIHRVQLAGQFHVGLQADRDAVAGDRGPVLEGSQRTPPASVGRVRAAIAGQRRVIGVDGDQALVAVDNDDVARADGANQPPGAQHGGQAERARHDGGVALPPAQGRGEAADDARVHQGDIGRAELVGDDDRALGDRRERPIRRLHEVANQAQADIANVLDAGRDVGVGDDREILGDLLQLGADGRFGVEALFGDARRHTPDKP